MLKTADPPENNYPFRRETNKSHHANTFYLYRERVRHTQGILKLQVIKIALATSENHKLIYRNYKLWCHWRSGEGYGTGALLGALYCNGKLTYKTRNVTETSGK